MLTHCVESLLLLQKKMVIKQATFYADGRNSYEKCILLLLVELDLALYISHIKFAPEEECQLFILTTLTSEQFSNPTSCNNKYRKLTN